LDVEGHDPESVHESCGGVRFDDHVEPPSEAIEEYEGAARRVAGRTQHEIREIEGTLEGEARRIEERDPGLAEGAVRYWMSGKQPSRD
jgi:hypothetical protein